MAEWTPERLSVVVPTFNRPELLARVLAGLEAQTWPRERFEVIVVDDGGEAPAEPVVRAAAERGLPAVCERQENAGPATARNRGVRRAGGEVILFLDDDCAPTPAWLAEHARAHTRRGLAAMGRIDWHPDLPVTPLMRFVGDHFLFHFNLIGLDEDAPFPLFYTANGSVDRGMALAAGLFDEEYRRAAWEDSEFAYRLRLKGARFLFRPDALVHHLRGVDLGGFLRRERTAGHEGVRTWTKHPELRRIIGMDRILGDAVEASFFEGAGNYAWLIGAAEALGPGGPGAAVLETLTTELGAGADLERWRDAYVRERERRAREELSRRQYTIEAERIRADRLESEAATLRRELAEAERVNGELQRGLDEQRRAFAEQARWARDLEARLAASEAGGVAQRLVGKLRRPGA
jgi:GT2 family glycosyltransferase